MIKDEKLAGTKQRNEQIAADIRAGLSLDELKYKYGRSGATIARIANWYGLSISRRRVYQGSVVQEKAARNAALKADIQAGLTMPELTKKHHLSNTRISSLANQWGLTIAGQRPRLTQGQKSAAIERITMHLASGAKVPDIAKALGFTESYVYAIIREVRKDHQGPHGLPAPIRITAETPSAAKCQVLASKHSRYSYSRPGRDGIGPTEGIVAGRRYTIHEIQPINGFWWVIAHDNATKSWWLIPEDYFDWTLSDYEQGRESPTFTQPAATQAQAYQQAAAL